MGGGRTWRFKCNIPLSAVSAGVEGMETGNQVALSDLPRIS